MPVDTAHDPPPTHLLDGVRDLLARHRAGGLSAAHALRQVDEWLGPPVRGAQAGTADPARVACQQAIDGCRRALDRLRAGLTGDADTLEAIGALVARAAFEESQADMPDVPREPRPSSTRR